MCCLSPAASSPEGAGLEGMEREHVLCVRLLGPKPSGSRLANKFWDPGQAVITWSTGCTDTVLLHYLKRGANRDVFAVEHWALVLRIQMVVLDVLRCRTLHVYACVQCEW